MHQLPGRSRLFTPSRVLSQGFGCVGSGPAQRWCSQGWPDPSRATRKGSLAEWWWCWPLLMGAAFAEDLVPAWATALPCLATGPAEVSPTADWHLGSAYNQRSNVVDTPCPATLGRPHHYWSPGKCQPPWCSNSLTQQLDKYFSKCRESHDSLRPTWETGHTSKPRGRQSKADLCLTALFKQRGVKVSSPSGWNSICKGLLNCPVQ